MREEVLSSVGSQDMYTSGYQAIHLEGFEFYWEIDQLDVDAVCRPGIDTSFSPTAFDCLEMGRSVENPILLDDEGYKENSPPTTPVCEKTNRPPALLKNRAFGTRIENVPHFAYRNLFQ